LPRTGLIAKRGVEIPLERITHVNFSQTVFERMLGAGDLLIESAGSTGQSEFSNIPKPDEFQTLLYKTRESRSKELSGPRSAPAVDPAPAASKDDPAESIRKIAALRDEGLISEAEYEAKRRDLLEGM
ncbi:MAG: PH domain-containing protein, partial [Acidimicrobiia bacterium]